MKALDFLIQKANFKKPRQRQFVKWLVRYDRDLAYNFVSNRMGNIPNEDVQMSLRHYFEEYFKKTGTDKLASKKPNTVFRQAYAKRYAVGRMSHKQRLIMSTLRQNEKQSYLDSFVGVSPNNKMLGNLKTTKYRFSLRGNTEANLARNRELASLVNKDPGKYTLMAQRLKNARTDKSPLNSGSVLRLRL
jgi:hypothetical protein